MADRIGATRAWVIELEHGRAKTLGTALAAVRELDLVLDVLMVEDVDSDGGSTSMRGRTFGVSVGNPFAPLRHVDRRAHPGTRGGRRRLSGAHSGSLVARGWELAEHLLHALAEVAGGDEVAALGSDLPHRLLDGQRARHALRPSLESSTAYGQRVAVEPDQRLSSVTFSSASTSARSRVRPAARLFRTRSSLPRKGTS